MIDATEKRTKVGNEIARWVNAASGALYGPESHSRIRYAPLEQQEPLAENADLRREIARLQAENSVLKRHLSGN